MKNLFKVLALSLIVGLFGVVSISSLMASSSGIPAPQGTIKFTAVSGICWNPSGGDGSGGFDVYNANGVSFIASDWYISTDGDTSESMVSGDDWSQATNSAYYRIIADIDYNLTDAKNVDFANGLRRSLASEAIVSGSSGTGDKKLKGFPIVGGTALFSSNAGTIKNLIIEDPTYQSGAEIGIIAKTNTGTIDNCEVTKTQAGSVLDVGTASIGAIAYESNGSSAIIRNCTNRANLTTTGTLAAGIVASTTLGQVASNTNYGSITGDNAAGIIALSDDNTQVLSNQNHGDITGTTTACGILASGPYDNDTNITDNTHNQTASITVEEGGESAKIFIEKTLGDKPYQLPEGLDSSTGIYYLGSLKGTDVFLIDRAAGLSRIGDGETYDIEGTQGTSSSLLKGIASTSSEYYIVKPISDATDYTETIEVKDTTLVDGQNHPLTNFPIKSTGSALFSTIASGAIVKNIDLVTNSTSVSVAAGILCYQNNGRIENCVVGTESSTGISTSKGFGGIAYQSNGGYFILCTNRTPISFFGSTKCIGGIVADATGPVVIADCINSYEATLSWTRQAYASDLYVGGIVGLLNGGDGLPLDDSAINLEGLPSSVTSVSGAVLVRNTNYASIIIPLATSLISDWRIGGIAGAAYHKGGFIYFIGCQNISSVNNPSVMDFMSDQIGSISMLAIGGIVGDIYHPIGWVYLISIGNIKIKNTMDIFYPGTSVPSGGGCGGIVGYTVNNARSEYYVTNDWVSSGARNQEHIGEFIRENKTAGRRIIT